MANHVDIVSGPSRGLGAALAAKRLGSWLADAARQPVASVTLVNNAGVVGLPVPLGQVPLHTLIQALRGGLEASLLLSARSQAATAGWAVPRRVMNTSSGLGRRAIAGSAAYRAAYCAAKAGVAHVSRAVALEEAGQPQGARIVSVAPGVNNSDMQAQLRGADRGRFPEAEPFAQLHSQGQLSSADDCARRLLAYLHSPGFAAEPAADIRTL